MALDKKKDPGGNIYMTGTLFFLWQFGQLHR